MSESPVPQNANLPIVSIKLRGRSTACRMPNYAFPAHRISASRQHPTPFPLLADEFPMAAAYYPIVFAGSPTPIPAAVVGLRNDHKFIHRCQRAMAGRSLSSRLCSPLSLYSDG